jgi:16S rRNA (cytosine1402-N4)-methyltransferase
VIDWDEEGIANIIYGYGEDRFARRIANRIVNTRVETPIETSVQLADLVRAAVPAAVRRGRIHPATKTFQALRIAVNEELQVLETFIEVALAALNPSGRLAIITFHSLEDRVVKHAFKAAAENNLGTVVTKRPITASTEELAQNPRARSAKLRIFQTF